jgi:hypothetical protein
MTDHLTVSEKELLWEIEKGNKRLPDPHISLRFWIDYNAECVCIHGWDVENNRKIDEVVLKKYLEERLG